MTHKMQCAHDTNTGRKKCSPFSVFWLCRAFFVRSEQKLISRFGKERLNNIWQAQVPPRSVRPSLPQWEGNLAAPGEAVPTLRRRDSLCLWYPVNIMRSCLNTQISCKNERRGKAGHVQVYLRWTMEVACGDLCVVCSYWHACSSIYKVCSGTGPPITCTFGQELKK